MNTLHGIRVLTLTALTAMALAAPVAHAVVGIAELGAMTVTARNLVPVADLGSLTVSARRTHSAVADLGSLTVLAPRGNVRVADLGSLMVTAPRSSVTVVASAARPSRVETVEGSVGRHAWN